MSSINNSMEECECINNGTIVVHVIIQRKLNTGVINEIDAKHFKNMILTLCVPWKTD